MPSIPSIYLSQDDEIIEPSFVKVTPYIQETLNTHYLKRSFNSNGVCFLEFCKSPNNLEPFHIQCYSRASTLVCDHIGSESNQIESGFCKVNIYNIIYIYIYIRFWNSSFFCLKVCDFVRYATLRMCDLNSVVIDLFLLRYFCFWDSSFSLFYLKSVGSMIPVFKFSLFGIIFSSILNLNDISGLPVQILIFFWNRKMFSKVNITPNIWKSVGRTQKTYFESATFRLVNIKIQCISFVIFQMLEFKKFRKKSACRNHFR